jgi:hypothetical protein
VRLNIHLWMEITHIRAQQNFWSTETFTRSYTHAHTVKFWNDQRSPSKNIIVSDMRWFSLLKKLSKTRRSMKLRHFNNQKHNSKTNRFFLLFSIICIIDKKKILHSVMAIRERLPDNSEVGNIKTLRYFGSKWLYDWRLRLKNLRHSP